MSNVVATITFKKDCMLCSKYFVSGIKNEKCRNVYYREKKLENILPSKFHGKMDVKQICFGTIVLKCMHRFFISQQTNYMHWLQNVGYQNKCMFNFILQEHFEISLQRISWEAGGQLTCYDQDTEATKQSVYTSAKCQPEYFLKSLAEIQNSLSG